MAGHKPWKTLRDQLTPEQRTRSDAAYGELLREMVLAELRKHSGLSQQELAERLGITQPSLSKMEGQDDMQISTLNRLVESIGGSLELVVHLPDGDVRLTQFSQDGAS